MEREALNRLQGLRETEVPYPAGYDSGIDPDVKVVDSGNDPRFPKVVGRTRDVPSLEVPDFVSPPELRSEQSMIGGSE